ncbi:hypothetical protein SAMN02787073_4233 [Chryseobacterium vrystaatense]|uniref:Uncharacterized protein n=1 Tax=Chryseobacterium vrystaatense TaxID=307480 RepID=A0A1M5JKN2_9FLAO|nr:hypothetical protein SAMN02787073_4233 [Chryseobacterium vrystaatense]
MVNIIGKDGKKEDYTVGYSNTSENLDLITNKVNIQRSGLEKKVLNWGKNHKIRDYHLAFINYQMISNLVYLKAKEKFPLILSLIYIMLQHKN